MKSAGQRDRSALGAREHEVTRFAISRRGVFPANRHRSLPGLSDATVTLRELTAADAPSLLLAEEWFRAGAVGAPPVALMMVHDGT